MKKKEHLFGVLYGTYNTPLSKIKTLKDYYKTFTSVDLINLDIDLFKNIIDEVEWALENPDYDFNSILETDYPNDMLYKWFKIYRQHLLFMIDKYNQGQFIITEDDVPDDYEAGLL